MIDRTCEWPSGKAIDWDVVYEQGELLRKYEVKQAENTFDESVFSSVYGISILTKAEMYETCSLTWDEVQARIEDVRINKWLPALTALTAAKLEIVGGTEVFFCTIEIA